MGASCGSGECIRPRLEAAFGVAIAGEEAVASVRAAGVLERLVALCVAGVLSEFVEGLAVWCDASCC